MNKENIKDKNPNKWTWYLFLFANIIFLVGIGIAWIILRNNANPISYWYVSIIVCDIVAAILITIFFYFETQELFYLKMHVPRKCFFFYLWSGVFFVAALIFTMIMTPFIKPHSLNDTTLLMALLFGVSAFLTLVSVGLYRYGKFKIELAIYRRRHGETQKKQEEINKEKTQLQNLSDQELDKKRQEHDDYSSITTPTSNLVNNVDKEQKN